MGDIKSIVEGRRPTMRNRAMVQRTAVPCEGQACDTSVTYDVLPRSIFVAGKVDLKRAPKSPNMS